MTKVLSTLVKDIHDVVNGNGGWDTVISDWMSQDIHGIMESRFTKKTEHTPGLRMSNLGKPCIRQLWYSVNDSADSAPLPPAARLKFLYGDLLESLLLALAKAAGHDVQGMQDELSISGIKGHRDAVIDGITVDVKSASPYAFMKFKNGGLREDDAFGYISQLSSYVLAGREHEVESHPTVGAFFVINKVSGEICLDVHDFSTDIENKVETVNHIKEIIGDKDTVPDRGFEAVEDGYRNRAKEFVPNGNLKLGVNCSYCDFKSKCWENLRTFMYRGQNGGRPVHFTEVVKEPNVPEVT